MNRVRLKKRTVVIYDPPLETGYYGRPGMEGGRVHVRIKGTRKPICGANVHEDAEFCWCAMGAWWDYIECGNCKRLLAIAPVGE